MMQDPDESQPGFCPVEPTEPELEDVDDVELLLELPEDDEKLDLDVTAMMMMMTIATNRETAT